MAHIPISWQDVQSAVNPYEDAIKILTLALTPSGHDSGTSLPSSVCGKFDVIQLRKKMVLENKIKPRELFILISCFMIHGNNVAKIMERMVCKETAKKLRRLAIIYQINSNARNNRTVTLARIAYSFPEVMAVILMKKPDMPGLVGMDDIRQSSGDPEYPSIARQPALACFIPQGMEDTSGMLNVFLLPNILLANRIFDKQNKFRLGTWRQDPAAILSTQKEFQTKAYKSVIFNEDERICYAVKFGMIISKEDLRPSPVWENAKKHAKDWLIENYGSSY